MKEFFRDNIVALLVSAFFLCAAIPAVVGVYMIEVRESKLVQQQQKLEEQHKEAFAAVRDEWVVHELMMKHYQAEGVLVYDFERERALYAQNVDQVYGLASLVKIILASVVFDIYDHHEGSSELLIEEGLEQSLQFSYAALSQYGEYGFDTSQWWSTIDLAEMILVNSSNDAAYLLGEVVPNIEVLVSQRLAEFGFSVEASIKSLTGLDEGDFEPTVQASPDDLLKALRYLVEHYPEHIAASTQRDAEFSYTNAARENTPYYAENTNPYVDRISNLVFSKTGYTVAAGGNLAVVIEPEPDHFIAVIVLNSTFEGRFDDVRKITQAINGAYMRFALPEA